jgi:tetratricopeptide (TPR) repeat protein
MLSFFSYPKLVITIIINSLLFLNLSGQTHQIEDELIILELRIDELFDSAQYIAAFTHLEKLERRRRGSIEKNHDTTNWFHYVKAVNKLAECKMQLEKEEEGIELLTKLLSQQIDQYGEKNKVTASIYYHLGMLYDWNANFEKSIFYQKKSLLLNLELIGVQSMEVAYNKLWLARSISDYEERSIYIESGLSTAIEILGEDHPKLADFYYTLSRIERNAFQPAELVENLLKKALNITMKYYGEIHLKTKEKLIHLADFYRKKHDTDKARQYYIKALNICNQLLPEGDPVLASLYHKLGNVAHGDHDLEKASYYYQKVVENKLRNKMSLTSIMNSLGFVELDRKNYDKAKENFQKSYEAMLEKHGDSYAYTVLPLLNLGYVHSQKGDFEKSIEIGKKALAYLLKLSNYLGVRGEESGVSMLGV